MVEEGDCRNVPLSSGIVDGPGTHWDFGDGRLSSPACEVGLGGRILGGVGGGQVLAQVGGRRRLARRSHDGIEIWGRSAISQV